MDVDLIAFSSKSKYSGHTHLRITLKGIRVDTQYRLKTQLAQEAGGGSFMYILVRVCVCVYAPIDVHCVYVIGCVCVLSMNKFCVILV